MISPGESVIVIGDTHGRPIWERIVQMHPKGHFVFVGDYFDSKGQYTAEDQISNFQKIVSFRDANPDRVTLLIGNHDFHYLPFAGESYGGYQPLYAGKICSLLLPEFKGRKFKVCLLFGKYLISHAGITRTWCRLNKISAENPESVINDLFYTNPAPFRFSPGLYREPTGDEPEQGPLWVRPYSLSRDYLRGFVHVIGHTQRKKVYLETNMICIDVLGFTHKYIEINQEGDVSVRTLH